MQSSKQPRKPQKRIPPTNKKRFPWWTLPVIAVLMAVLVVAYVQAEAQIVEYSRFTEKMARVAGDTFFGPIYIDDVQLTGMTMDEAREALAFRREATARAFGVTLTYGGQSWRIDSSNVPMVWNTESLLQKAYAIGRKGSLEERLQAMEGFTEPLYLASEYGYDRDVVQAAVNTVAMQLAVAPVDATVLAFDVTNRTFAYAEDVPGQAVDAETLYQIVIAQLESGQGGEIAVVPEPVPAAITRLELEESYTIIASYSTKTTSDSNRNNNIALAAEALNGVMIMPGETISFNETTGQRTVEKGYKEAGAISGGRSIQEIGGGVCQVSTTMFNALVRADCEIVSRKPHAWPVDYVPRGEDAAVDWPGLDVVLRNASDAQMFLAAWYKDQRLTVEVYGRSLGDGVTIDLHSETTYSKEPTEVVYTYNPNLPVGTAPKLLRKPRTAYAVQTYKIYLQDGVEVSREPFYTSDYRMINEEYEYNDGNPPNGT